MRKAITSPLIYLLSFGVLIELILSISFILTNSTLVLISLISYPVLILGSFLVIYFKPDLNEEKKLTIEDDVKL